jgi:hypothetical protein
VSRIADAAGEGTGSRVPGARRARHFDLFARELFFFAPLRRFDFDVADVFFAVVFFLLPPPVVLLTVAQARASAVFFFTPRFS